MNYLELNIMLNSFISLDVLMIQKRGEHPPVSHSVIQHTLVIEPRGKYLANYKCGCKTLKKDEKCKKVDSI